MTCADKIKFNKKEKKQTNQESLESRRYNKIFLWGELTIDW